MPTDYWDHPGVNPEFLKEDGVARKLEDSCLNIRCQGEVRVKDPKTGGEKGQKLARFSLIPSEFLWALAEHYGIGAHKYDDRNWERGYKWSLSLDASQRHLNQWILGEDGDPETGTSHLICAIWHLIALYIFHKRGLGTDDIRLKKVPYDGLDGSENSHIGG